MMNYMSIDEIRETMTTEELSALWADFYHEEIPAEAVKPRNPHGRARELLIDAMLDAMDQNMNVCPF